MQSAYLILALLTALFPRRRSLYRAAWVLRTITAPAACLVSLLYWAMIFPSTGTTDYVDASIHGYVPCLPLVVGCAWGPRPDWPPRSTQYRRHLSCPQPSGPTPLLCWRTWQCRGCHYTSVISGCLFFTRSSTRSSTLAMWARGARTRCVRVYARKEASEGPRREGGIHRQAAHRAHAHPPPPHQITNQPNSTGRTTSTRSLTTSRWAAPSSSSGPSFSSPSPASIASSGSRRASVSFCRGRSPRCSPTTSCSRPSRQERQEQETPRWAHQRGCPRARP